MTDFLLSIFVLFICTSLQMQVFILQLNTISVSESTIITGNLSQAVSTTAFTKLLDSESYPQTGLESEKNTFDSLSKKKHLGGIFFQPAQQHREKYSTQKLPHEKTLFALLTDNNNYKISRSSFSEYTLISPEHQLESEINNNFLLNFKTANIALIQCVGNSKHHPTLICRSFLSRPPPLS